MTKDTTQTVLNKHLCITCNVTRDTSRVSIHVIHKLYVSHITLWSKTRFRPQTLECVALSIRKLWRGYQILNLGHMTLTTPTDPITTHQSAALATPTGSLTARQSGLAVAIHA